MNSIGWNIPAGSNGTQHLVPPRGFSCPVCGMFMMNKTLVQADGCCGKAIPERMEPGRFRHETDRAYLRCNICRPCRRGTPGEGVRRSLVIEIERLRQWPEKCLECSRSGKSLSKIRYCVRWCLGARTSGAMHGTLLCVLHSNPRL